MEENIKKKKKSHLQFKCAAVYLCILLLDLLYTKHVRSHQLQVPTPLLRAQQYGCVFNSKS